MAEWARETLTGPPEHLGWTTTEGGTMHHRNPTTTYRPLRPTITAAMVAATLAALAALSLLWRLLA